MTNWVARIGQKHFCPDDRWRLALAIGRLARAKESHCRRRVAPRTWRMGAKGSVNVGNSVPELGCSESCKLERCEALRVERCLGSKPTQLRSALAGRCCSNGHVLRWGGSSSREASSSVGLSERAFVSCSVDLESTEFLSGRRQEASDVGTIEARRELPSCASRAEETQHASAARFEKSGRSWR